MRFLASVPGEAEDRVHAPLVEALDKDFSGNLRLWVRTSRRVPDGAANAPPVLISYPRDLSINTFVAFH
jgi:hypothetical protein